MGLFDKKYCDICGEKIGLLGNRKLEDGNLCKDCAKQLSPWFSDRRRSTVEDIKRQLAYREENRGRASQFRTTRSYGEDCKVLLDEEHRWFTVTRARDLADANPDILDYTALTGCRVDIDESRAALLQVMETSRGGGAVQTAPMQQEAPMQQQETFAPAPATAGPWTCPACGGQNDGKFCEYCGAPRG